MDEGLSTTERGDEAPEDQRIKGTSAESVSYQEGKSITGKRRGKTVNKPKKTDNKRKMTTMMKKEGNKICQYLRLIVEEFT